MTKSLTELWKDGELLKGVYYIIDKNGEEQIDYCFTTGEFWFNSDLKEVLAPVSSYEECKETKEKLHLANEMWTKWYNAFCEKQKEINKLQEQLDELKTEENSLLNDIVDLNLTIKNRDKQLDIVTKALNKIERIKVGKENNFSILIAHNYSKEALKEIKKWGVK